MRLPGDSIPHHLMSLTHRLGQRYGAFLMKRPILIYQMGKVGSTAIEETLQAHGVPALHLHSIGGDLADHFKFRRSGRSPAARLRRSLEGSLQGLLLRIPNRRVKVITLVREPLARNISAFFQALRKILWDNPQFDTRSHEDAQRLLVGAFHRQVRHDVPATWFDREIRRRLGIDVFAHPFPHDRGWLRISAGHVDLLVLRMESLAQCEDVLADFTGLPGFRFSRANVSEQKWYAPLYRDFRKNFPPDAALLDQLYGSHYMRHFYTMAEIAAFRESWGNPSRQPGQTVARVPALPEIAADAGSRDLGFATERLAASP